MSLDIVKLMTSKFDINNSGFPGWDFKVSNVHVLELASLATKFKANFRLVKMSKSVQIIPVYKV
jgi:hypothetical protein